MTSKELTTVKQELNEIIEVSSSISENEKELIDDLETCFKQSVELYQKYMQGLDELLMITKQSSLPMSYDILAKYFKEGGVLNKNIAELAREKNYAKRSAEEVKEDSNDTPDSGTPMINNALFIGSTAELARAMKLINETTQVIDVESQDITINKDGDQ